MNKIFDFNLEDSLKELKIFTNDLFSPDKESIPTAEDLQNLINNDPATFIDNYIKLIKKCNFYIDENQMRKQHMAKLLQSSKITANITLKIENENSQLKQELELLKSENSRLQAQLAHLSQRNSRAGRPRYNSDFRQRVIDFYNESDAHTYQATAQEFNISTNTVGRILKENA